MKKRNFYKTCEECMIALRKLNPLPTSQKEYKQVYIQDPKLPCTPDRIYPDFPGWPLYLGKNDQHEEKVNKYPTWKEASKALDKLSPPPKSFTQYRKTFKQDSRLPSGPDSFYEDYPGADIFFNKIVKYQTWQQAAKALSKLNPKPKTIRQYKKVYMQDPRLPADPRHQYPDFPGFHAFINNKPKISKYESWQEASSAIKLLRPVPGSSKKYSRVFQQDPRLPGRPNTYYEDFPGWSEFLGRIEYFNKWQEAREAVLLFEPQLKTSRDYRKRYKEHERLPPKPLTFYKDFPGWDIFLSRETPYKTWQEAQEGLNLLESIPKSYPAYSKSYKNNPRLVSLPNSYYRDFPGWDTFLDKEVIVEFNKEELINYCSLHKITSHEEYKVHKKIENRLPRKVENVEGVTSINDVKYKPQWLSDVPDEYSEWVEYAREWIKDQKRTISDKKQLVGNFIRNFLVDRVQISNLRKFFDVKSNPAKLQEYIDSLVRSKKTRSSKNHVNNFLDYCFKKVCCDVNDDTGEVVVLPGFRQPYKDEEFEGETGTQLPETVKHALPYTYIVKAREKIAPSTAKTFSDLAYCQNIAEADWVKVDESLIDVSDPDCVWRKKKTKHRKSGKFKGYVYEMWSPIRAIANLTLFSIPIRGQQICWLDSGEGDYWKLDFNDSGELVWMKNDNPLAEKNREAGFLHRFDPSSEIKVGMRINTNKTGTGKDGYDVSYIPPELIPWLVRLRNWQTKYNPVSAILEWKKSYVPRAIHESILKRRDKVVFLFRRFQGGVESDHPIPTGVFAKFLPAILYQIQDPDLPLAYIEDCENPAEAKLHNYQSIYTPHCLRVSLITAYIVDFDLSVTLVSKLVGHASIVMTIYYTKISHADFHRQFTEGEEKMLAKQADHVRDLLVNRKVKEAKSQLLGNDKVFFSSVGENWPAASMAFSDWGICPMGGAGCDQGGECLGNEGYTPVPAGYLGRANCIRCRFFITGPAFLGGLKMLADEIALEASVSSDKMGRLNSKIAMLDEEAYDCEVSGSPFMKSADLQKLNNLLESETLKFDGLMVDLICVTRFAKESTKLLKKLEGSTGDKAILILNGSEADLDISIEDVSLFRQLHEICKNAEIYSSANPSRAIPRRSQLLDAMAKRNGIESRFFEFDEEQQLAIGNQMTRLLLSRLGSWSAVDRLIIGDSTVDELVGGYEEAKNITQEMENLMKTKEDRIIDNQKIKRLKG